MGEMWDEIKNPDLQATLRWYFPRSVSALVTGTIIFVSSWREAQRLYVDFLNHLWGSPLD